MEFWENAKIILETCVAFGILIAGVSGFKLFKYKVDSEDRKLYLENCNIVRKVLGKILQYGHAELCDVENLQLAYQNALLYLDKDISAFILKVLEIVIQLHILQASPELPIGEEKTKKAEEIGKLIKEVDKLNKQSIGIYRKHIIFEPTGWFKNIQHKIR